MKFEHSKGLEHRKEISQTFYSANFSISHLSDLLQTYMFVIVVAVFM